MEIKEFQIEVTETLSRVIKVKAATVASALEHVQTLYKQEQIILSSDDFMETEFQELNIE